MSGEKERKLPANNGWIRTLMSNTTDLAGSPSTSAHGSQITILRIKRKRNEEPLDALLVQQDKDKRVRRESQQKQDEKETVSVPTALPTLFRLAETVEEHSFKDIKEAQKLKDRIARRIAPSSRPMTPESREEKSERKMKEQSNINKQARYRVIQQNRNSSSQQLPPVVQSASEKAANELFQMYEAVKDEEQKAGSSAKLFLDDDDTEDADDIMCNFIPMVKEYLTLNEKSEEEDYVYDVYYRDDSNTPMNINASNIGSLVWFDDQSEFLDDDTDSELGDHEDEDSNAEDYYQNDYPEEESGEDYDLYNHSGASSGEYDSDGY